MIRSYYNLPTIPDAGPLTRYLDTLGVIVPLARVNLCTNPSVELSDSPWTTRGTVISAGRTTAQSYHGAYSFAVTPSTAATAAAMNGAGGWGSIVPLASTFYAVSAKVRGALGVPYQIYVEHSTGPVTLASYGFTGTGRWQWVWIVYQESGVITGSRNYFVGKNNSQDGSVFYIDGLQVEAITDGYYVPTTYIDGDQKGLVPNQYPPTYGWSGAPHASSSFRSGQTRAGGRIVRFRDQGFMLTAILGLGLAPPQHQALTFAQLDGGQYENTLKPPRTFSLAGRVASASPNGADAGLSQLSRLLDRDLVAQRQPLVLTMQAQHCGADCGERVTIPALYSGGLEGQVIESPTQQVPASFTQYIPYVQGRDQGVALDVQDTISSFGGILTRAPTGTWTALTGGGVSGGNITSIVIGLNGLVYIGGAFTAAGTTAADFIVSYNPQTQTWATLGSATALNNTVNALAVGPDGRIYVGGDFTNANGIANADYIAVWDPLLSTWAALSTGMNNPVNALAWVRSTLYAGGSFTVAGGVAAARVAAWNGSAWSALGTGANALVLALAAGPGDTLYIGGQFTNGGGVAAADFIGMWRNGAWAALSTGMDADVLALIVAPNGLLYAGGLFTTAGGVTAGGIASWNGVQWQQVGSGFTLPGTTVPNDFAVRPDGTLLIAATGAVADPGNAADILEWNGSAYVSLGIVVPTESGIAIALAPDGTMYAAFTNGGGTVTVDGATTATQSGTAEVYPTLVIRGPTSGTARLYELINATTNTAIYLNYTISAGELLTLTLNPTNITWVSSFAGDILNAILPGSETTAFVLQPGINRILILAGASTVTATLWWQLGYGSLNDALYQAVAP